MMQLTRQDKGKCAEDAVCAYLKKQGYLILQRNFRFRQGEIDIIAQREDKIYFIEVKARTNERFGHPLESIVPSKKDKIVRTAECWLLEHAFAQEVAFMAAAVFMQKNGAIESIELVEDFFIQN